MASLLRYYPSRRIPLISLFRAHHTSSPLLSSTPSWQALVGGREVIEKKRQLFEEKYRQKVERKAKEQGLSIEELKDKARVANKAKLAELRKPNPAPDAGSVPAGGDFKDAAASGSVVRPTDSAVKDRKQTPASQFKRQESPVKPLGDILDLSKAATLPTTAIAQLWTTYHQTKGLLSAAIPTETYERMVKTAKQYPLFVLPLARDALPEMGGAVAPKEAGAVEMHLLQWAFLPPPPEVIEPVPSPSTVLFTPLAEYHQRQSYAQPYLILTHYTDLANSHNLVLLRGEITDNVALNAVDAQLLAVRTQLFYNWSGLGGEKETARRAMLKEFHEKPEEFNVEQLVKLAWEID